MGQLITRWKKKRKPFSHGKKELWIYILMENTKNSIKEEWSTKHKRQGGLRSNFGEEVVEREKRRGGVPESMPLNNASLPTLFIIHFPMKISKDQHTLNTSHSSKPHEHSTPPHLLLILMNYFIHSFLFFFFLFVC